MPTPRNIRPGGRIPLVRGMVVVWIALPALAVYILLPQIGSFRDSLSYVSDLQVHWLLLALLSMAATYGMAACTYQILSYRRLHYHQTLLVQWAAVFINRLVPGGLGSMGANYMYLRRQHHSAGGAASIVAMNNVLGLVGHAVLLVGLVIFSPHVLKASIAEIPVPGPNGLILLFVLMFVLLLAVITPVRRRLRRPVHDFFTRLRGFGGRPHVIVGGLISSICLTACYIGILFFVLQSTGLSLSYLEAAIAFSFGVVAGTVTPTPGGIGGVELGLVSGLVLTGLSAPAALAAALIFRLLTYWLAFALGAIAFVSARHQQLF